MGTYPELPASVLSSGEDLQQVLNAHKERLIGEAVLKKFGTNLPFLPKVGRQLALLYRHVFADSQRPDPLDPKGFASSDTPGQGNGGRTA